MNRAYRLVWNVAQQCFVIAPETARSGGQGGRGGSRAVLAAMVASLALPAWALPVDGQVVGGSGTITQGLSTTLNVNQSSSSLALNWQSFNISAGETVNFIQPSSHAVALNRVTGPDPSAIFGRLNANGQVFLVNGSGILFGQGAQVNVGGLVASTLDLSAADFMAGRRSFGNSAASSARVENSGSLNAASGGYIALLGGQVSNQGTISAQLGSVALAAGQRVKLDFAGDKLLSLQVEQGTLDALAENQQLIQADGGQVVMTAQAADKVLSGVVNNTGIVQARGISTQNGVIRLSGDVAVNTGALDVSGPQGGSVAVDARSVLQAGTVNADGASAGGSVSVNATGSLLQTAFGKVSANAGTDAGSTGGSIALNAGTSAYLSGTLEANGDRGGLIAASAGRLTLAAATVQADGRTQGGTLLLGGDAHGAYNPALVNATSTFISPATTLSAQGAQGKIVAWADDTTNYFGSAKTDPGGFIEISGKGTLNYGGQADAGVGGNVLLDPTNLIIDASASASFYLDLANPNPSGSNSYGASTQELSNGNILVNATTDSFIGANTGALFLFNGSSGALISSLFGSKNSDFSGTSITLLANGNFLYKAPGWDNGTVVNAGAVAWGSASSGFVGGGGPLSSANALAGVAAGDVNGAGITTLSNGNYVLRNPTWDGTVANVGAVTWGSGTAGVSGNISSANSLIGSAFNDSVGSIAVATLSNGNYVALSPLWDNGTVTNAGAATWGSGTAGVSGVVSGSNSLVGGFANDSVGSLSVLALSNGNYVVLSPIWHNGTIVNAGAATWGSGTTGVKGTVSSSNSLVGSRTNDGIAGTNNLALSNGNYILRSIVWDNGTVTDAGAVTWGSGTAGVKGTISSSNSLVGSSASDGVGNGGLTTLSNGNYVVLSPGWDNGTVANAGAATWGSGTAGVSGVVSSGNSLVGSTFGDSVGAAGTVTTLSNGNYVVRSPSWDNGTIANVGAVTWGSGTAGVSGPVSSSISLIGSIASEALGGSGTVIALSNGNYVVNSPLWDNGTIVDAGAVTWANGTSGVAGTISSSNSLVGGFANDSIGNAGVSSLANGNYVVFSTKWHNGTVVDAGALTWGSGTAGVTGLLSSGNSLVGSSTGDSVGSSGIATLANGNFVVKSVKWHNGTIVDAGAVTWGSGTAGVTGVVSSSNSLVGSATGDSIGGNGITVLSNGNYVVISNKWHSGTIVDAGAVTWGSGTAGVTGVVSSSNSLVGSATGDIIGGNGVTELAGNGNYVVISTVADIGGLVDAGAATWGSGTAGVSGVVSSANSLVGASAGDMVGGGFFTMGNGNYLVPSIKWHAGTAADAGAVTWGSGTAGISGVVSSANSLVGSSANDSLGSAGTAVLSNGNYVVRSPLWDGGGGTLSNVGAATWGSGTAGVSGTISSANSLVGSSAGDQVGNGGLTTLSTGNYVVQSSNWHNGTVADAGAVTWGSATRALTGVISSGNSLLGSRGGDSVGSGGVVALANGNYLVRSNLLDSANLNDVGALWLGVDPANLGTQVNAASGTVTVSPTAIADAAGSGSTLTLQASNNVTVNSAVSVAGKLNLVAGNTVTLNAGIASTSTGDAVQLSGLSFVNNVGAGALSTPNGRWLVWTTTPANDTRNSLAYDFKQYNATYGTSSVLGTGNGYLYTVAPTVSTTLTGSVSKVYDATLGATLSGANYGSTSGALDGDTVTLNNPTTGTYDTKDAAASGKTVTATGVAIASATNGAATVYGYQLGTVSGAVGTITPKPLTTSGLTVPVSKVYDATITAVVGGAAALASTEAAGAGNSSDGKAYAGDMVSIAGTATGAYNSKDVATASTVTYGGLSLAGADLGNYSLTLQSPASATITPKLLSMNGLTVPTSKVYDATTTAVVGGTAALATAEAVGAGNSADGKAYTGDTVSIAGTAAGIYNSKDVATANTVTYSGLSLAGADLGNYNLTIQAPASATITPKSLSMNGLTVPTSKIYDATTTAFISGTAALASTEVAGAGNSSDGRAYTGDMVSITGTAAGTYNSKDVATASTVTYSGLSLAGADLSNYNLTLQSPASATITPKSLSMSGLTVPASKVYDATTTAVIGGTAALATTEAAGAGNSADGKAYTGDTVSITGTAAGTYNSKDVATASTVTYSGLSLAGADLGNYNLTLQSPASATITPKSLSMSGLTVPTSKVYDATTIAVVSETAALASTETAGAGNSSDGKAYTGDTVSITGTATGTYNSKDVATANTVTYGGLSLAGADLGNYSLTLQNPASATITPKSLSMSGLVVPTSKVYDATTTAVVSGTAALASTEAAGAGNSADGKAYTGDTAFIAGTATGTYNSKDVVTASTVTYSGLSLAGADLSNYSLTLQGPTSATITPKSLSMSGLTVPTSKVYDATTTAVVSGTAALAATEAAGAGNSADGKAYTGDTISITGTATGTYNSKDVATASTVTYSGLSLAGTDVGNYNLTLQGQTGATITPKSLSMSGLIVPTSKVYDATTTAVVGGTAALASTETAGAGNSSDGKAYTGDTVSIAGTAAGIYNSKDVAAASTVTYSGLSLVGADLGNYSLTLQGSTSATITPKSLSMSGLTAPTSKVYDATTAAVVGGTATLASTETAGAGNSADGKAYTGDTVSITGTAAGTYNSKDVATASTVTYSGLSLAGADLSNYSLTLQSPVNATITPKSLSMSDLTVPTSKVYDATTIAVVSGTAALASTEAAGAGNSTDGKAYNGDAVSIAGIATGTYNSKDVATASTVTYSGLSLAGADLSNYSLTLQGPTDATITPKSLSMSGLIVPNSKVYDATTIAVVGGTAALASTEAAGAGSSVDGKAYTGDMVSIVGTATGTYESKDVATASSVSFAGLSLAGADIGNYSLIVQSPTSATITPKSLSMSGLTVPTSKVYDATTTAVVSGTAALASTEATGAGNSSDGKAYTGDTVSITGTATGTYNSKDVATASTVTFGGLALAGTDYSNYSLTLQSPASATITTANPVLAASSIPIAPVLISIAPLMNPTPVASLPIEMVLPPSTPVSANAAVPMTNAAEPASVKPISANGSESTAVAPAGSPIAIANDTSVTAAESATNNPAVERSSSSQDTPLESSARRVLPAASRQLSPFTTLTILGEGIKLPDKPIPAKK